MTESTQKERLSKMTSEIVLDGDERFDLINIPFEDQIIPAFKDSSGIVWVALKPICDNLGIDHEGQRQKLKVAAWSLTCLKQVTRNSNDFDGYRMMFIDRKTLIMWLATITTSRIKNDDSRRLIEDYQIKIADVLEDYFFPKSEQRQLPMTPHEEHMQQVQLMQSLKGLIHPDFLEAKARIVLAKEMHETPEIDHDAHPLYVQDYLKENGLSSKRIRSKSMTFGKLLKREYIDRYHREPMKAPQMINGRMMDVYAYTERDRDLFDKVWRDMNLTLLIED